MEKIRSFLSSNAGSLFCLSIAILSRIVNVMFVSYAGRDKMFLVLQSKSLLEGKGLGVPQFFTTNPELAVYDYTPMWPPGYPVMLAPFLKIFNNDIYRSTTALDIVACLALIFVVRKICRQLEFPTIAINLMTLVVGCFEYTFINDSKPTDNIPIVLFLLGISLLIKQLSLERFSFSSLFIAAFILFLPSVFRYSYPPLSIAVAMSVLFIGFIKKETILKKQGLWLLIFVFILNLSFSVAMKMITGYAGYAVPTDRGYFPENLAHWFPVVPSSFINIAFLTSQTAKLLNLSFETTMLFLEMINIVVVCSLVGFFVYFLFSKKFLAILTPFKWFLFTGFFASAAIFVSLGYLSLTYKAQDWRTTQWSYVYDHRYYAFVVIFLQIIFFGWLYLYKDSVRNWLMKVIVACFSLALFIEITHNIYFHTKVAFAFKEYKSAVYREQDYVYFFNLLDELEKKYPGHKIWSAAPGDDFYPYAATYLGHTGIADAAVFKTPLKAPIKKTILTLTLYDHELGSYTYFLSRAKILSSSKVDVSNYYVIELAP
jgi:hypothetical protein